MSESERVRERERGGGREKARHWKDIETVSQRQKDTDGDRQREDGVKDTDRHRQKRTKRKGRLGSGGTKTITLSASKRPQSLRTRRKEDCSQISFKSSVNQSHEQQLRQRLGD